MDDLGAAVSSILSDPEAMEQISAMAKQLGLSQMEQSELPETPELPVSPETMGKLMSAVRDQGEPDDATRFLEALRPLLRREMQGKMDRALKAVKLMRTARAVTGVLEL